MLVNPDIKVTGSTSSGALALNTPFLACGLLHQIIVNPTTDTTEYIVTITDRNNLIIFNESRIGNTLRELILPVVGILTINITSATRDEVFVICLKTRE